jgi:hypothetical protein
VVGLLGALTPEEQYGGILAPMQRGQGLGLLGGIRDLLGPSVMSRMQEADTAQQARWDAGERSPTPLTEENMWLADDVAGGLLGPMGFVGSVGDAAKRAREIANWRGYYSRRTWPDAETALREMREKAERENAKTASFFPPTDLSIFEELAFVKAPGGKVKVSQRGANVGKRAPVQISEEPLGSAPDVAWDARDLINSGTPESAMQNYGRGKGRAYQGYIKESDLPKEKMAGGRQSYGWDELESGGAPPPATVRISPNGAVSIMDGNHRIRFWRDKGFEDIPVFVIDERGASK